VVKGGCKGGGVYTEERLKTKQAETNAGCPLGHTSVVYDFLCLKAVRFVGIFDYVEDVVAFEDVVE